MVGRFVHNQQTGTQSPQKGKSSPGPFTTRKAAGCVVPAGGPEAHPTQQCRSPCFAKSAGKLGKKGLVWLQAVKKLVEVGGADPIAQGSFSRVGPLSGQEQAQQGGLACSVGPHQGNAVAAEDAQRGLADDRSHRPHSPTTLHVRPTARIQLHQTFGLEHQLRRPFGSDFQAPAALRRQRVRHLDAGSPGAQKGFFAGPAVGTRTPAVRDGQQQALALPLGFLMGLFQGSADALALLQVGRIAPRHPE